ncbi:hypothetical protein [Bifidobacterium eulemuris]
MDTNPRNVMRHVKIPLYTAKNTAIPTHRSIPPNITTLLPSPSKYLKAGFTLADIYCKVAYAIANSPILVLLWQPGDFVSKKSERNTSHMKRAISVALAAALALVPLTGGSTAFAAPLSTSDAKDYALQMLDQSSGQTPTPINDTTSDGDSTDNTVADDVASGDAASNDTVTPPPVSKCVGDRRRMDA